MVVATRHGVTSIDTSSHDQDLDEIAIMLRVSVVVSSEVLLALNSMQILYMCAIFVIQRCHDDRPGSVVLQAY